MEPENNGHRIKFKALHYPKDTYDKEGVETASKYLEECPWCTEGKHIEKTDELEAISAQWRQPKTDGSFTDISEIANLPQKGDNWLTRSLFRNDPEGKPSFLVLAGVGILVGTIIAGTVLAPVAKAVVDIIKEQ